ncbi:hypothetical protein LNP25_28060 [Klebsiella variicola subsp. variicola]|nr:hypothetical protein [Klebsiella variicola subsp. variicola]
MRSRSAILTNTWVGIYHADRPLCRAAIALALTPGKACGRCGSHLAAPLILAGVRTALVQLIATAVVRGLCRSGRAGTFSIDGLGQQDIRR